MNELEQKSARSTSISKWTWSLVNNMCSMSSNEIMNGLTEGGGNRLGGLGAAPDPTGSVTSNNRTQMTQTRAI